MCDRKSQLASQTFGKPTGSRCSQPCMFQILSWAPPSSICNHPHEGTVQCCSLSQSMICQENKIPENKQTIEAENNHTNKKCDDGQQQLKQEEQQQNEKIENNKNVQQKITITSSYINEANISKKKKLHPHPIMNQLYMYDQVSLKKSQSEIPQRHPTQIKKPAVSKVVEKKLDSSIEEDKEIIKKRLKRIKEFQLTTRDLPNSAFTTYYGKPAFESYGRCNSQAHMRLKTHNVMPHRGDNHPTAEETYSSALLKGKKITNAISIPRKPLENLSKSSQKQEPETSSVARLPLQKPDLINQIRFSDQLPYKSKNIPVPKFAHSAKKQLHKKYTFNASQTQKKSKKNRKNKTQTIFNDGLKYLNIRGDLLSLIEEKKLKDSKLAYKVTECYPMQGWKNQSKNRSEAAGVKYQKSESVGELMYAQ